VESVVEELGTLELCHDPKEWDGIAAANGSWIYQSWGWGELRRDESWIPWRLMLREQNGTRLGLQIFERRIPFLASSLLYAPRPPRPRENDLISWHRLVDQLRKFLRERRAILLRIDPDFLDSDRVGKTLITRLGFQEVSDQKWSSWGNLPRSWMIVDLRPDEDAIFHGMRENHRRSIRKAGEIGVVVDTGTDDLSVSDLHRLLLKTSEKKGFEVRDLDYFFRLRDVLLENGHGKIFIARHQGSPVAATACARFGASCYYLYGGFDFDQRHATSSHVLHWRAIQWAKSVGCTEYNLIGTGTKFPPAKGSIGFDLYNFKKGFGSELRYYAGYFDLVGIKTLYAAFRILEAHASRALYRCLRRID
jgi:lipid II:glycine glycyltransferase (peptidoglycan interpeptide bridge formation enzyme)